MASAKDILKFWFGELDDRGFASEAQSASWWKKDPAFDEQIRGQFLADYEAIAGGERESWLGSARPWLAYVIVLDQFSRNMFRDTPRMFEADPRALGAARSGIQSGFDRELAFDERGFCYLPFMHAESIEAQDEGIAHFERWRDELTGAARERVLGSLGFAQKHRDIIARFGRFPHRNAILGRTTTASEMAFLTTPGSSF